jgi:hypothetical protein
MKVRGRPKIALARRRIDARVAVSLESGRASGCESLAMGRRELTPLSRSQNFRYRKEAVDGKCRVDPIAAVLYDLHTGYRSKSIGDRPTPIRARAEQFAPMRIDVTMFAQDSTVPWISRTGIGTVLGKVGRIVNDSIVAAEHFFQIDTIAHSQPPSSGNSDVQAKTGKRHHGNSMATLRGCQAATSG